MRTVLFLEAVAEAGLDGKRSRKYASREDAADVVEAEAGRDAGRDTGRDTGREAGRDATTLEALEDRGGEAERDDDVAWDFATFLQRLVLG